MSQIVLDFGLSVTLQALPSYDFKHHCYRDGCVPARLLHHLCRPAVSPRRQDENMYYFSFLTTLVWALVICVFSAILLCALAFLVLGWFKLSSFFYY